MRPKTFPSAAAFLGLSFVDIGFCIVMFLYSLFFKEHATAGVLLTGAAIGFAHASAAFLFFRKFMPEFLLMMAVACGLAALIEKADGGSSFRFFEGFALPCLLGVVFFAMAMAAFHLLGFWKKSRIIPMTFWSVFIALLLAVPISFVWNIIGGIFMGIPCVFVWYWILWRRDASYWLEFACLSVAAILLSYVYAWLQDYLYYGSPGLEQLIGAALFAALAVPLSLRHKRRKAAAKAEAGEWLDARIASAGDGVDVLSDLAGAPMVSVGSPATLAAVRDCLRGARWLPKAKFLKEGDKTAPDTRLDLGGNVAENGVFWFRSPGTGREQAFVFVEKDWERLADLAATVKADGTGGTAPGDSSGTGAAGSGDAGGTDGTGPGGSDEATSGDSGGAGCLG